MLPIYNLKWTNAQHESSETAKILNNRVIFWYSQHLIFNRETNDCHIGRNICINVTLVILLGRFIPESVRWLRITNQSEKALAILRKVAKFNKKEFPEVTLRPVERAGNGDKHSSIIDIFRPCKMAVKSIIQGYTWWVPPISSLSFPLLQHLSISRSNVILKPLLGRTFIDFFPNQVTVNDYKK